MTKVVDFIIITALEEEREAVLGKLSRVRRLSPSSSDVQTYYSVRLPVVFPNGSQGIYRLIVLSLIGMGRVQAATATNDAIRKWKPRYVVLVGIAGGVAASGIGLGDVIISDQIVDFESQKLNTGEVQVRWEVYRADPRLLSAARSLKNSNWQQLVKVSRPKAGKPKRVIGPIASGDKVIAVSKVLELYKKQWHKLIGVEMEAGGAALAAFHAASPPGFFMIRGVSDLANENKGKADVEIWRAYACDVAAAFTISFLKKGPVPLIKSAVALVDRQSTTSRAPINQKSTPPLHTRINPSIPLPKIKKNFTQFDKDKFAQKALKEIKLYFRQALKALKLQERNVEYELTELNDYKFICRVYVEGHLKNQCKLWCGNFQKSTSIYYAERSFDINSDQNWNDWFRVEDDSYELYLERSSMWSSRDRVWDTKLSQKKAAEYVWCRFSESLAY